MQSRTLCVHAAGFDSLETVVVLGNQMTVDKLKSADAKFGVDIDLIVGRDSALAQTDNNWTETETAVSRNLPRMGCSAGEASTFWVHGCSV